jgi:nucleoside-diphosphate-sugar epimerase
MTSRPAATIVTGVTGCIGSLIAQKLLADTDSHLLLPIRPRHSAEVVLERMGRDLAAAGLEVGPRLRRLTVLPLPPIGEIGRLRESIRAWDVGEIIHCAGCVDYFHRENLAQGNPELTRAFVQLARVLHVRRFAFISTAFSSGYCDGLIREQLHGESKEDPTEYTCSKREAEAIVAGSDLPYLIIRPSIVIGDSRDGRYGGKRYGLYQLWYAAEKLVCSQYLPRIYAIAPRVPLQVIHQDAFQDGFLAAFRTLPDGSIIHLVSNEASLPTVRGVWDLWLLTVSRPREIYYFERLSDAPLEKMSRQQQVWVELTGVNLDISSRPWRFETTALDGLRRQGLKFADASADSISICQNRFVANSERVRAFMDKYSIERAADPHIIEC